MTNKNADPGLLAIAESLSSIAVHLKYLGVGDAASTMGAVEFHATKVEEVAQAGHAIADGLNKIAEAIEGVMHGSTYWIYTDPGNKMSEKYKAEQREKGLEARHTSGLIEVLQEIADKD